MGKYIIIVLIISATLGLVGCGNKNSSNNQGEVMGERNEYIQIGMDEAIEIMEEETDYIVLDVRTPKEYAQSHIPNAINIPNEVIGTDEISELPDKDQLIMVYCRSGNRSKQASEKLVALGYTNIVEFGGINDWPGETVSE